MSSPVPAKYLGYPHANLSLSEALHVVAVLTTSTAPSQSGGIGNGEDPLLSARGVYPGLASFYCTFSFDDNTARQAYGYYIAGRLKD